MGIQGWEPRVWMLAENDHKRSGRGKYCEQGKERRMIPRVRISLKGIELKSFPVVCALNKWDRWYFVVITTILIIIDSGNSNSIIQGKESRSEKSQRVPPKLKAHLCLDDHQGEFLTEFGKRTLEAGSTVNWPSRVILKQEGAPSRHCWLGSPQASTASWSGVGCSFLPREPNSCLVDLLFSCQT